MIIGAVVLAAGKSERMGQNKLLLPLNNKPLIENILDGLEAAHIPKQVIVFGHNRLQMTKILKQRLKNVRIAVNLDYERGMTSSFQTGLLMLLQTDAAFLVLGDEPIVDPYLLIKMAQILEKNDKALIVSPVYNGKKGHPLLFRRQIFQEILNLDHSKTIREIVHKYVNALITVDAAKWTTMDIDTPQDYQQFCNSSKSGQLD